ncbi:MAG: hypothetical protein ACRCXC_12300 [Legionella sp.]
MTISKADLEEILSNPQLMQQHVDHVLASLNTKRSNFSGVAEYWSKLIVWQKSDRTRKAGGLTVVSSPNGCRRLVETNFKNYLSHPHRSFYRAAPDFEYIP